MTLGARRRNAKKIGKREDFWKNVMMDVLISKHRIMLILTIIKPSKFLVCHYNVAKRFMSKHQSESDAAELRSSSEWSASFCFSTSPFQSPRQYLTLGTSFFLISPFFFKETVNSIQSSGTRSVQGLFPAKAGR